MTNPFFFSLEVFDEGRFVAFAFKVSTILLDLRLKSRRPPSRSSLCDFGHGVGLHDGHSHGHLFLPPKPPPDGLNGNGFHAQFQLLEDYLILNGQAQNIHSQFFRRNSAATFRASLPNFSKLVRIFSSSKSAQFSSALLVFRLKASSAVAVSFPSSAFWSSSQMICNSPFHSAIQR